MEIAVCLCFLLIAGLNAFSPSLGQPGRRMSSSLSVEKATLTEATEWQVRLVLNGVMTEKGRKVNEIFALSVNFVEEEGYEPPQGQLKQVLAPSAVEEEDTNASSPLVQVQSSRWQLSEDPNDRKDGLWIWGLFEEPLYPFMLLQFTIASIPLSGSDNDAILPLSLYAQINHSRDDEKGVVLQTSSDLKIRQVESIKADPFGAANVDIFEEVSIGSIALQPVVRQGEVSSKSS